MSLNGGPLLGKQGRTSNVDLPRDARFFDCRGSGSYTTFVRATTDTADRSASVSVWFVPLAAEIAEATWFRKLSATERARADGFRVEADRRRFVLSHAALRALLGQVLGTEASAIQFATTRYGKPELARPFSHADVSFNLSHCDDLAVVAIARGQPVGVDVECLRYIPDCLAVARIAFSTRELQDLTDGAAPQRSRRFMFYWTRKEALIKAMGDGLSDHLPDIDTFTTRAPTEPLQLRLRNQTWTVQSLDIWNRDVAAVAVRAGAIEIQRSIWNW
jgi:Phosphopantetheinyl transferase